jgi:hypothetical protein
LYELYLVYRVRADGSRAPEAVMSLSETELPNAANHYDALIRDDNPEIARQEGESWEFVPRSEADAADWEQIVPPGSPEPVALEPSSDEDLLGKLLA